MEGIRDFGCVRPYCRALSFSVVVLACLLTSSFNSAQAADNVNVSGSPRPNFDWDPNRQENEVSCGTNPDNELIKVCAMNGYGYADVPGRLGDAWIWMSTTRNGYNWTNQPITGTIGDEYLGADFAADPTVIVIPRGAFIFSIAGSRDGNTKMYLQRLVEMPRETGIPYALEKRQQVITNFSGINFIDKPHAEIIIKPGGALREVAITTNEMDDDGEPRVERRFWPEFTICVSYAVFGGSNQNIRTFATCSDDFGAEGTWSNPRQITQNKTGGLDQGMSSAAKNGTMLYVTRRFDSGDGDAIIGSLAKGGYRPGKTFHIADICPFDQNTAPNIGNPKRSSPRTLDFPWLSATHEYYVLTFVGKPRDPDTGNCLPFGGTRTMILTSKDGRKWSDPVPVLPFGEPVVHLNIQPNVACARGTCNVVYYSTLTEALAFREILGEAVKAKYLDTEEFIEDFDVLVDAEDQGAGLGQVLRFRRSVDVYSTKITFADNGDPEPGPPNRISEYQIDYDDKGRAFEYEWSSTGNLIYGGMSQPFHGDYLANAVAKWRKDPVTGLYESNAGPIGDVDDEINNVRYFAAWTDHRRIRGFLYDDVGYDPVLEQPLGELPFETVDVIGMTQRDGDDDTASEDNVRLASLGEPGARPAGVMDRLPGGPVARARAAVTNKRPDRFLSAYGVRAAGLKDREVGQPAPPTCTPGMPETNFGYPYFNANAKNAEIYGAVVDPSVRLVSPTIGKGFISSLNSPLQRGFVIGIDNISAAEPADPTQPARRVLLVIANQPGEAPLSPNSYVPLPVVPVLPQARASWRQLPFGPAFVEGVDPAPDIDEILEIDPLETEYVTLFVVASVNDAPVTVYAYDADDGAFIGQLTVNGNADLGDLIDAPGVVCNDPNDPDDCESINLVEIHDPELVEPVWGELEIIKLADNYDNPNVRSPNVRSTAYQSPNVRSPNVRSVTYESTTKEATSLESPNVRSPNVRSTSLTADSFIDVTYTVESNNNTITAMNADFGYGGDEIGDDNVQVIAWREDQLTTEEDCQHGFISESKVISSKTSPNVRSLAPADINEPFQGEVSFTLAPAGPDARAFVTMRVFCNDKDIDLESGLTQCEDLVNPTQEGGTSKLQNKIGYNFWAQKANTGKTEINQDNEQIFKDVIAPLLSKEDGYQFVAEAEDSGGAVVDITNGTGTGGDKIEAEDNGFTVDVFCDVEGSLTMPPSVKVPVGDSDVICVAEDIAENVANWEGTIRVEDNTQPVLATTPPGEAELKVNPTSEDGAETVNFITLLGITATDTIADNADLVISCTLEDATLVLDGSPFKMGETPVFCTASDPGPCDPLLAWCKSGVNVSISLDFVVNVVDLVPPTFTCNNDLDPTTPECDLADLEIEALADPMLIDLVEDYRPLFSDTIDDNPILTVVPDQTSFGLGTFDLVWTATDFAGNFATATQTLIVQDTTDPEITMPADIVRQTNSLSGLEISFPVTATDEVGVQSIDCVETGTTTPAIDPAGYLFPVGPTLVTCTATDTSGNPVTAAGSTATGEFKVTVEFQYSSSGISGKASGKTGSVFPLEWAWTDESGTPQTVSEQTLSIEPDGCPADGNEAQDPGQSGLRQDSDGNYIYNLKAIDPSTQEPWVIVKKSGDPYCFTVALPTGESQSKGLTIRP